MDKNHTEQQNNAKRRFSDSSYSGSSSFDAPSFDGVSAFNYAPFGGNSFGAVILAAGYSSRMKAFKPLLPVGETSAIERLVEELREVGISEIVIVTGHGRERLQPVIDRLGAVEAYNGNYDKGMFSSIKTGLAKGKALFPEKRAFFLIPVDCPLISSKVLKVMMEAAAEKEVAEKATERKKIEESTVRGCVDKHKETTADDKGIVSCNKDSASGIGDFHVPIYEGKKGHPLMIPSAYIDEICSYGGPGGLKGITDKYWDKMNRVPVDDEGCILDMDTPEGYEEIKEFLENSSDSDGSNSSAGNGGSGRELKELAAGRRIFLIRHGETRQHDEKMFIGQYDVPMSDEGREQIRKTAIELAEEAPHVRRIYTSDLSRAAESAMLIKAYLEAEHSTEGQERTIYNSRANERDSGSPTHTGFEIDVEEISAFREINLGAWDGQKISDVKKQYLREYERRGADLFAFKTGNKSENFYDMQYRAVKALRKILKTDPARDIVIVTHSGVIRALENNLKGLRVDDEWQKSPKGSLRIIE